MHTPGLTKRKQTLFYLQASSSFTLALQRPRFSPDIPASCTVPKLSCIPAFEMRSISTNARSQNICPIPKRISESTNKRVPRNYLNNRGDIGGACEQHGTVSNNGNLELADTCISYIAFQDPGNDTSAMNTMEDLWKKGRLVVNSYCQIFAFLDYAAMIVTGRGTCEIPRTGGGQSGLVNRNYFSRRGPTHFSHDLRTSGNLG